MYLCILVACCLVVTPITHSALPPAPPIQKEFLDHIPVRNESEKDGMGAILEDNAIINAAIAQGLEEPFLVEGDIYVPPIKGRARRNAVAEQKKLWPGAVVPYVLNSQKFTLDERKLILAAMDRYHEKTCIQFRPRTNEKDYILISRKIGCWSQIGRQGGVQYISLGLACHMKGGTIIHELMHSLGFRHEHSRPDRDGYVNIYWENVVESQRSNFHKYSADAVNLVGTPYDYSSIMHYPLHAFSKNGKVTIGPRYPHNEDIGWVTDFSDTDIYRLNNLYKCGECFDSDQQQCPAWAMQGECKRNRHWMRTFCPFSCDTCPYSHDTDSVCKDISPSCRAWVTNGECDKNRAYMHENCKRSCGLCINPEGVRFGDCHDNNTLCADWAVLGECSRSPAYMHVNCRKSCRRCNRHLQTLSMNECRDYHPNCQRWAKSGECSINRWIYGYCKLSCKQCTVDKNKNPFALPSDNKKKSKNEIGNLLSKYHKDDQTAAKTQVINAKGCKDKNKKCATWAKQGECKDNQGWMHNNCPVSCDTCGKPDPTVACEDAHSRCPEWAKDGNCVINKEYMKKTCAASCLVCKEDAFPLECNDRHQYCRQWAESGYCESTMGWMRMHCPVSCNACVVAGTNIRCSDGDSRCPEWALKGECRTNTDWMIRKCKLSCKQCVTDNYDVKPPQTSPTPQAPDCKDTTKKCVGWAKNGDCEKNPKWMKPNCPLSCNSCEIVSTLVAGCRDVQRKCPMWAENGDCQTNPNFMFPNCPLSCNSCNDTSYDPGCIDKTRRCKNLADRGDCETNKKWMNKNCALTCNTCAQIDKKVAKPKCNDSFANCPSWAKDGGCLSQPDWMGRNCRLSCKTCRVKFNQTEIECVDGAKECQFWALKGRCSIDIKEIPYQCPRSCQLCSNPKDNECKNYSKRCKVWAKTNWCKKNPAFMSRFCGHSCRTCKKVKRIRKKSTRKD
ncbi:balbiani ring protein 3-like isoform X2 [Anneissia japonica]|uniref:balbiani ring protein 3-like isoform X2 n=1 Tax=Anneissia japonica TaxID=1529436 RepID=UPI0014255053|nr:balbiani ring protein 3-like isoform X2 [Anneissia japonica]